MPWTYNTAKVCYRKIGLGFSNTLNFEDESPNQQTILDRKGTEDIWESEEGGNSDLDLSA
jgi:hypothetical protein